MFTKVNMFRILYISVTFSVHQLPCRCL